MAVILSMHLSGGAANTDPALSIGGAMSSSPIHPEMFGTIPATAFTSGTTRYRLIYVKTSVALSALRVFRHTDTPSTRTKISLGWAAAGVNQTEAAIANQTTAPPGVTFTETSDPAAGPNAGAMTAGQWRGLWIKYEAQSGTASIASEYVVLGFDPVEVPVVDDSVVLFDAGEFVDASITAASGSNNQDRYIRGGPFNQPVFATNSIYQWWELAIVGNSLPNPAASYAETSFKTVMGRGGSNLRVMSASIKADSPNTSVEQIRLTDYQTAGVAGGGRVEPIFYQRMWVKFDERELTRAQRVGSSNFYHIFWECKCEPDYRLRVQLQYNGTKLYWVSHTDVLTNANHIHSGSNTTVNVVLAPHSSAAGWHKIEVYMNRPAGIFRAAVDGSDILNVSGVNLMGASGNIANFPMFTQNYCAPAINANFTNDAPAEILFSGLKLWNKPPADAWQAGAT